MIVPFAQCCSPVDVADACLARADATAAATSQMRVRTAASVSGAVPVEEVVAKDGGGDWREESRSSAMNAQR
jgi:hypothetical protein